MAPEPMAERVRFRLGPGTRRNVHDAVDKAPVGYVTDIRPETRSDLQNRLMWPLLEDVAAQVVWHKRKLPAGEWKNGFMMALAQAEFIPGINPGTIWPLGLSTSALNKAKFSELIDLIYAFGAENGVRFRTDREAFNQKVTGAKDASPDGGEA